MQGVSKRIPQCKTTMIPIKHLHLLAGRKITYDKFVVDTRPLKAELEYTWIKLGGNCINYPFDVTTPTVELDTTKIMLSSIISTPTAKEMIFDLKDFYLNTYLPQYEYMKIPLVMIKDEIMKQYNLHTLTEKKYVHFEIQKGMYGLLQLG